MKPCGLSQSFSFSFLSKRHPQASEDGEVLLFRVHGEKEEVCRHRTRLSVYLCTSHYGRFLPLLLLLLSTRYFVWTTEALATSPPPTSTNTPGSSSGRSVPTSSNTPGSRSSSSHGSRSQTAASSDRSSGSKTTGFTSGETAAAGQFAADAREGSSSAWRMAAAGASENEEEKRRLTAAATARREKEKEDDEARERKTARGTLVSEKDACPALSSLHHLFARAAEVSSAPPARCPKRGVRTPRGQRLGDSEALSAAGNAASAGNPRIDPHRTEALASRSPPHRSSSSSSAREATDDGLPSLSPASPEARLQQGPPSTAAAASSFSSSVAPPPPVREAPLLLEKRVRLRAPRQQDQLLMQQQQRDRGHHPPQHQEQQQQQSKQQQQLAQEQQQADRVGPKEEQQRQEWHQPPWGGSFEQQEQPSWRNEEQQQGRDRDKQQHREEEEAAGDGRVDFVELVPLSSRLRLPSAFPGETAAGAALLITCSSDGLLTVHTAVAAAGHEQQQTQLATVAAAHAGRVVGLAVLDRSDSTGKTTIATVDALGELRLHLLRLHASPAAPEEAAARNAGPHQIDGQAPAAAALSTAAGGGETATTADQNETRQSRLLLQERLTASLDFEFSVHHEALKAEGSFRVLTSFLGVSYKGDKYLLATDSAGYVTVLSRSGALYGRVRVTLEEGGVVDAVCRSGVIVLGSRRSFMQFHVSTMDVGRTVGVVDSPASIRSLALDPQRQTTLAVALQDGQLLLYNLKKAALLQKFTLSSLPLAPVRIFFFRDMVLGVAAAPSPCRVSACGSPLLADCPPQQGVVFTCALPTPAAAGQRGDASTCQSFSLGSVAVKGAAALYQSTGSHFFAVAAATLPTASSRDAEDSEKAAGVRLFEVLGQQAHSTEEEPPWFNFRFPVILVAVIAVVVLQIFKSGKLLPHSNEDTGAGSSYSSSASFGVEALRALPPGFTGFESKDELRRKLQRADALMRRPPRRGPLLNACGSRFDVQPQQHEQQYGCGYVDEEECSVRACLGSREMAKHRRRTRLSVVSSSSNNSTRVAAAAVLRCQSTENHFFPPELIQAERSSCRRRALHRSSGCFSQEAAENYFSDDLLMPSDIL